MWWEKNSAMMGSVTHVANTITRRAFITRRVMDLKLTVPLRCRANPILFCMEKLFDPFLAHFCLKWISKASLGDTTNPLSRGKGPSKSVEPFTRPVKAKSGARQLAKPIYLPNTNPALIRKKATIGNCKNQYFWCIQSSSARVTHDPPIERKIEHREGNYFW